MKGKIILFILQITFIVCIVSCGTTQKVDYQDYFNRIQEMFKEGTDEFFQGNYAGTKNLFINYNQIDSSFLNYESYAFLSECYVRLGMQDSGKYVYENIIHKLNKEIKEKPTSSQFTKLVNDDLEKWYSNYPNFPAFLKKENGFVPYDSPPEPIGGVSEIQKYLVYPNTPDGEKLEGTEYVLTLVDEHGKPIDYYILQSIGKPYDEASINAIKQISFTIPKRKGTPHNFWVAIPIKFQLR